ncbi:hypothetical protein DYB36_008330 [Aphanomyces astaci]|uniref:Uncharacterized protein n=1 Tax=Aphanomyces astaci TaxID=112090 RepID=A0A397AAB5_APHAT|nr:hypothetical protein DYB36_008330 [Aphanomyces astaci]
MVDLRTCLSDAQVSQSLTSIDTYSRHLQLQANCKVNDREAQLRLVYATVEAYVPTYEKALDTLQKHLQHNMTADALGQWYCRDPLRSPLLIPCTGLGIDDGNALIIELDSIYRHLKKRKPMHLDTLESQLDILDRDTVGPLDKRLSECKKQMEGLHSAYYSSASLIVHGDVHVELIVRHDNTIILLQKQRSCVEYATCSVSNVSLNDLKKSYGVDVDERERSLEAFQNEVEQQHTSTGPPPSKRPREPVDDGDLEVLQSIRDIIQRDADSSSCHVQYGGIRGSWGDVHPRDRIDKVIRAAATSAWSIRHWTMHDMDVGSEELTAFASAIHNSSALKSSLQTLHLRSVNVDPAMWALPLKHVVAGLTACAEAGRLQRLSVADNVFTRGFLGAFMQIMAVGRHGLDLHMLNLRFVCEQDSNDRSTALEFDKLVVRHLHLDFSTLILDTTFLASMAKAVAHPACVLETLEMPSMRHPADASLMEV